MCTENERCCRPHEWWWKPFNFSKRECSELEPQNVDFFYHSEPKWNTHTCKRIEVMKWIENAMNLRDAVHILCIVMYPMFSFILFGRFLFNFMWLFPVMVDLTDNNSLFSQLFVWMMNVRSLTRSLARSLQCVYCAHIHNSFISPNKDQSVQ